MVYAILKYAIFFLCFGLSFYAISSIQFDKLCNVREPKKVQVLMFLLSLALAHISSQAIMELTIWNGFGI